MSNAYVALKRLLPPSSLLVGKVTAHHTDDETSTVVLPTQQGVNEYAAGVATGSTIRARGTFVPVGANAFVRDGVIESRAPDENASEIVIGAVVPVPMPLTFSGPIPDQTANVGAAVAVDLTGYWSGGTPPLAYALGAGTLPAGMTVGSGGTLGGTPSAAGLSSGLVVRATDRTGFGADSNAFGVAVTAAASDNPIFLLGQAELLRSTDGGATWVALSRPAGWVGVWDLVRTPTGRWILSSLGGTHPNVGLATSTDLQNWSVSADPEVTGSAWDPEYSLAAGPTRIVGVKAQGNSGRRVVVSTDDGASWTHNTSLVNASRVVFHATANVFVAVSGDGVIYSSADATAWASRHFATASCGDLALSANTLVAAPVSPSATSKLRRSTDALTWSLVASTPENPYGSIASNGAGGFVVGATNMKFLYSTDDGVTWTASAPLTGALSLGVVAWTGARFVAVVRTGLYEYKLFESVVGDAWTLRSVIPATMSPRQLRCYPA